MLVFTDAVLACIKHSKESMKQLPEVMISLWTSQNPRPINRNELSSYISKQIIGKLRFKITRYKIIKNIKHLGINLTKSMLDL